jgi:glutamate dehydrogenase
MEGHPLRREIAATALANRIVEIAGPTFVGRVESSLGCGAEIIAPAFAAAGEIFGLRRLWEDLHGLDGKLPTESHYALYRQVARTWRKQASRLAARLLESPHDIAGLIELYARAVERLRALPATPPVDAAEAERDFPAAAAALAREIRTLPALNDALAVSDIARDGDRMLEEVAALFDEVGRGFGFAKLQRIADSIETAESVEALAVRQVAARLRRRQEHLSRSILKTSWPGASPRELVRDSRAPRGDGADEVRREIDALDEAAPRWSLARLLLAAAAIDRLTE